MIPIGLDIASCRTRQDRLRSELATTSAAAAVLLDARHVLYFSGHWTRAIWPSALIIHRDPSRPTALVAGVESGWPVAVEAVVKCELNRAGTIIDEPGLVVWDRAMNELAGAERIGTDIATPPESRSTLQTVALGPALRRMRRRKDADEIALLRRGAEACDASYARVRDILRPGLSEMDIFAEVLATATRFIGEPIGELGNDFRSGSGGGPARNRGIEAGELLPLDLGISVRGYSADTCRTFCVGNEPTELQRAAHAKVLETIAWVEPQLKPGTSCRALHEGAEKMLGGFRGLSFGHHLGHGIGLNVHEAPRLNRNWDDVLEAGDVVTVEPGLYGNELRGGIRIENDYVISESGFQRLSDAPVNL